MADHRNAGDQVAPGVRARLRRLVDGDEFQGIIIALIFLSAVLLGLDAIPEARALYGDWLMRADGLILIVFVIEIALRILAHGPRFFRDPWSLFDFSVVLVSVLAAGGFAILRAFRILRALRLISAFSQMRLVISALLTALPGIGAVGAVLVLILYVSAIIATGLFGQSFPHLFGDLFLSMYTLFKVMTLEGWPDIADEVLAVYPMAWIFFVLFIMVGTLTLLNLFIAIIVNAMEASARQERQEILEEGEEIEEEVRRLRAEVAEIARHLGVHRAAEAERADDPRGAT